MVCAGCTDNHFERTGRSLSGSFLGETFMGNVYVHTWEGGVLSEVLVGVIAFVAKCHLICCLRE